MAAFVSGEVSLPASTATKIVDVEDFDRRVLIYGDAVRVAFTSAAVSSAARLSGSDLRGATSIALPADEELWAYHAGGTVVGYLVTNTS